MENITLTKVLIMWGFGRGYENWASGNMKGEGPILFIDDNAIINISIKSCLSSGKSKIDQKFQHLFKTDLIHLANTATPLHSSI